VHFDTGMRIYRLTGALASRTQSLHGPANLPAIDMRQITGTVRDKLFASSGAMKPRWVTKATCIAAMSPYHLSEYMQRCA
jgi:hypothetical protein